MLAAGMYSEIFDVNMSTSVDWHGVVNVTYTAGRNFQLDR